MAEMTVQHQTNETPVVLKFILAFYIHQPSAKLIVPL